MKLISCDNCAVVLDHDKINWPYIWNEDGYTVDTNKCTWNGEEYVPIVNCPVCEEDIVYKSSSLL